MTDDELKREVHTRIHDVFKDFAHQYLPHVFDERFEAELVNTRKRIERYLEEDRFTPDEYEFEFSCISRDEWNRERQKHPNLPR